jgi:hypothetical protein
LGQNSRKNIVRATWRPTGLSIDWRDIMTRYLPVVTAITHDAATSVCYGLTCMVSSLADISAGACSVLIIASLAALLLLPSTDDLIISSAALAPLPPAAASKTQSSSMMYRRNLAAVLLLASLVLAASAASVEAHYSADPIRGVRASTPRLKLWLSICQVSLMLLLCISAVAIARRRLDDSRLAITPACCKLLSSTI